MSNITHIKEFLSAWDRRDLDGIISKLHDDVCYHNMPAGKIIGAQKVRDTLAPFLGVVEYIKFDVSNIAESETGAVLVEKREHYKYEGQDIICDSMNTFGLEDGKIILWRAYFDPTKWPTPIPERD